MRPPPPVPSLLVLCAALGGVFGGWAAFDALGVTGSSPRAAGTPPTTMPPGPGYPGDVAVFELNSTTYHVFQVGDLTTSGFVSGLDYRGPSGCQGRIFDVHGNTAIFRYSAHNALLQDGDRLFYFPHPPLVSGHTLGWSSKFTGDHAPIVVTAVVYCPLPSRSIPPIPDPAG